MRNKKWLWLIILPLIIAATVEPGLKISQYPNTATLNGTDLFILAVGNTNKNIRYNQLKPLIISGLADTNNINTIATNRVFVASGSTNVAIVTNHNGYTVTYTVYVTNYPSSSVADGVWTNSNGTISNRVASTVSNLTFSTSVTVDDSLWLARFQEAGVSKFRVNRWGGLFIGTDAGLAAWQDPPMFQFEDLISARGVGGGDAGPIYQAQYSMLTDLNGARGYVERYTDTNEASFGMAAIGTTATNKIEMQTVGFGVTNLIKGTYDFQGTNAGYEIKLGPTAYDTSGIRFYRGGRDQLRLMPTGNATDPPYLFDTDINRLAFNLAEFRNFGVLHANLTFDGRLALPTVPGSGDFAALDGSSQFFRTNAATLTQITNVATNTVFVAAGSTNVGITTNISAGKVVYTVYATNPVVPSLLTLTNIATNSVFIAAGSTNVGIVTNYGNGTVTYTIYATNDGGGAAVAQTNFSVIVVTNGYEVRETLAYTGVTNVFVNLSNATAFTLTLTNNALIIFTNPPPSPLVKTINIDIVQDGVGGRLVFWDSHITFPSAQVPIISSTPAAWDVISARVGPDQTNFAAVYQQNFGR